MLEKRPRLGGRATSYTLPDGSEVDNCQHVTLGCCTNLADFYRRAEADSKIRFYDKLYFADGRGRRSVIRAWPLPPPLHLAPSFLFFGALTMADKRAIAHAMLAIARAGGEPPGAPGMSMLDWLHSMRQTPGAIERFWRVVLVSALNEELARTDAIYGIAVFWKAFLASRGGYRLGIPSVPLAELYQGCRDAIVHRKGEIRLRTGVREIRLRDGRFAGVVLEDGTEMAADACIAAVPHDVLREMLPPELSAKGAPLEGLRRLRASPITGVHLWYDRPVMTEPFLALLDHTTQWIFNRTLLHAAEPSVGNSEHGAEGDEASRQYLQLVISASYDLAPRPRQEIIELCRKELADVLPATRSAALVKATVIKEIDATFSPEPGADAWRPAERAAAQKLYLAGDWTRTGWPATMEGAVRSGYLAAEAALSDFGCPRELVRQDPPFEGLSRRWARQTRGRPG